MEEVTVQIPISREDAELLEESPEQFADLCMTILLEEMASQMLETLTA